MPSKRLVYLSRLPHAVRRNQLHPVLDPISGGRETFELVLMRGVVREPDYHIASLGNHVVRFVCAGSRHGPQHCAGCRGQYLHRSKHVTQPHILVPRVLVVVVVHRGDDHERCTEYLGVDVRRS